MDGAAVNVNDAILLASSSEKIILLTKSESDMGHGELV